MNVGDPLAVALDRFDVPAMSGDLADRIVAAADKSATAAHARARRDPRGLWRRGRQIVVATVAAGMLSAGAVASGLLGRAGIEIPVLTAMLAPGDHHVAKPHLARKTSVSAHSRATVPVRVAADTPVATVVAPPPPVPSPSVAQLVRRELMSERLEARAAFAAAHPRMAAAIRRNVRRQMIARAAARQAAYASRPVDPTSAGSALESDDSRQAEAGAARIDRRRANAMIDRRIARASAGLAARTLAPDVPARSSADAPPITDETSSPAQARPFGTQLSPAQRAVRFERHRQNLARRNMRRLREGLPVITR